MNASKEVFITKRNGQKEKLNLDKIHFVVEEACNDLTGVSASQIEMNSDLQFYDGMTTDEIQNIFLSLIINYLITFFIKLAVS